MNGRAPRLSSPAQAGDPVASRSETTLRPRERSVFTGCLAFAGHGNPGALAGHDRGQLTRRAFAWSLPALFLAVTIDVGSAAEVTFVLRIENGRLPQNMRRIRVKQNDLVKLQWSADRPIRIHLHGYDIERELKPGTVSEMTFVARAPGRFTVEPHLPSSGGHAHGDVLVTIEVHP
jgi:hypothetical protein